MPSIQEQVFSHIQQEVRAVCYQIGNHYAVLLSPEVELNGKREPVFVGALAFELVDGKPVNITVDTTKWNHLVETRHRVCHEESDHKCGP